MHIVLMILKILGIVLLSLLGILLLLILLLLFVPFYYRAEGSLSEDGTLYGKARVRYLFPLLWVFCEWKEGKPCGKLKLLGLTVYDFFAPKKSKMSKRNKKKKKKEQVSNTEEIEKKELPKRKEPLQKTSLPDETDKDEEKPEGLKEKIKIFIRTLNEKRIKLLKKFKEIKEKGMNAKQKADDLVKKLRFYDEVRKKDVTKRAFAKAKTSLLKLFRSIRPKKGSARVRFGFDDPATTGQICGYYGMLYPFIGKYVMIEPDFEKKVIEGDFFLAGRITVFVILKVAWVMLFDKDIKRLRAILERENKEETYEQ